MQEDEIIYEISEASEETPVIEESSAEVVEVGMSEAFQSPTRADAFNHALLNNREISDAHPISAITGLRDELDEIELIKTVYANNINIANYHKWHNAAYNEYGYFVSIVPGTSEIQICDGFDIFGVSVESAGFIGGQNPEVPRDNTYGLIITSGLVEVRCELDVEVGDCIVSNDHGIATKSDSDYGYKVFGKEEKNGAEYAIIMLGVQSDVTNLLGADLARVKRQVDVNYNNIVSATNVANQAYNKSIEASESSAVSEDAVKKALEAVLTAEKNVEDFEKILETTNNNSAQAKAIAEAAVVSASSLKAEAVERANDAWAKADDVAKEAHSLCAKIDEYSVGEYSQAYGLTWEQSQSILKPGMIYAPTEEPYHLEIYEYTNSVERVVSFDEVTDKDPNKIYYDGSLYWYYKDGDWVNTSEMPSYKRIFTPGYLYQWGLLPSYQKYGWITIDRKHDAVNYDSEIETNMAYKAVYFSFEEVEITEGESFGYWYTNGDSINGKTGTYEPYTLYKWQGDHWLAVATLVGNASNRMVSEIYQTTNAITMDVANPRGCIAALDVRVTDTEASTQQFSEWKIGEESKMASVKTIANDDSSSVVISALQKNGDVIEEMARLVLDVVKDDEGNPTSALSVSADNINFEAENYSIHASKIVLGGETTFTTGTGNETKINGASIETGTLSANQITTGILKSKEYNYTEGEIYSSEGTAIDLDTGYIRSKNFAIDENGDAHFDGTLSASQITTGTLDANNVTVVNLDAECIDVDDLSAIAAKIGNWEITDEGIKHGNTGLSSDETLTQLSLMTPGEKSAVKIYAGAASTMQTSVVVEMPLQIENGVIYDTVPISYTHKGGIVEAVATTSPQNQNMAIRVDGQDQVQLVLEYNDASGRSEKTMEWTPPNGYTVTGIWTWIETMSDVENLEITNPGWLIINEKQTYVATIGRYGNYDGTSITVIVEYTCEGSTDMREENFTCENSMISGNITISTNSGTGWLSGTIEIPITYQYKIFKDGNGFMVLDDGSLYASRAKFRGGLTLEANDDVLVDITSSSSDFHNKVNLYNEVNFDGNVKANGAIGLSGWVTSSTGSQTYYMHFEQGILVEASFKPPEDGAIWLIK